jgi:hypothetical protein
MALVRLLPPMLILARFAVSASIEGRVLSTSGEPLKKATLTIISPPLRLSVETAEDGRFGFSGLSLGRFTVTIQCRGYASQNRTIALQPSQPDESLTFTLLKQAVITGRVTDQDGDPVAASVIALQYRYSGGRRRLTGAGVNGQTDEQGNYRIHDLPPGTYYLQAVRRYGRMKFTAAEFDPASPLASVTEGEQLTVNLFVRTDRIYRIRGKVVGKVDSGQQLTVAAKNRELTGGPYGPVADDGSFEIEVLTPGTYTLQPLPAWRGTPDNHSFAWDAVGRVEVTVGEGGIDGVELPLREGLQVAGAVRMQDGRRLAHPVTVALVDPEGILPGGDRLARTSDDGAFQIERVTPVPHRVEVRDLPEGAYVKSVLHGDRDATFTLFDATPDATDSLDITLAGGAAVVSGITAPSAVVAVWSDTEFLYTVAGATGAFRLEHLRPGEYRGLAWEDIEPGVPQYAPFRARFESRAVTIRLAENAHETPLLPLIPSSTSASELARLP